MVSPNAKVKELFKRLSRAAASGTTDQAAGHDSKVLDARTHALVVLGAAVCADSPTPTFKAVVSSALNAGATEEEILGVLFAVAPAAGETRLVSVTPRLSKALGYDIDEAFERG